MSDEPAELPEDVATRVFVRHRELLFSVVYSMTGSVSDTENILQDAWLAWVGDGGRPAADDGGQADEDLRAELVRVAVGHALARQPGTGRHRAAYPGSWLPEPTVTDRQPDGTAKPGADTNGRPGRQAESAESAESALLAAMETLPPLERAVFVLNEIFGYPHTEVAQILGRRPGAVRQLAHRARKHLQARRPRCPADPRSHRRLTERFVTAATTGDLAALLELLAPDVTMWTGGGTVRSALQPVSGRERVATFLCGYAASHPPQGLDLRYRHVDGDPSAVVFSGDSPYAVLIMDLGFPADQVTGICLVTNPDKLSRAAHHPDARPDP